MQIRSGGAELFLAEGRTDRPTNMTKLIVTFRNFANAPKNLMISKERIVICSEIHKKHINVICTQDTEFSKVKPGGTYFFFL
jgi:hypothetical protein